MKTIIELILKDWLQNKNDIVFTDDIAIDEVSDEIVEALEEYAQQQKAEWYKKLSKKLVSIDLGMLSLKDYIKEVHEKTK